MFDSGRGKQYICWSKTPFRIATNKIATTGGDKIDLVARVRFLRIDSTWRVNLDQERAMLKNSGEPLSFWTWQERKSLSDS